MWGQNMLKQKNWDFTAFKPFFSLPKVLPVTFPRRFVGSSKEQLIESHPRKFRISTLSNNISMKF